MSAYDVADVVIDKRLMDAAAVERERHVAETLLGSSAQVYEDADVLALVPATRGEIRRVARHRLVVSRAHSRTGRPRSADPLALDG